MSSALPIWASAAATARRWRRWPDAPRIVAESLHELADPLASIITAGAVAPADQVARAMAASLALPRSSLSPPSWLRPDQGPSFQRIRAALDRHGMALVAEPVGSGKSWIALAIASSELRGPLATVIVPASLLDQWRVIADRAGIAIRLWTHERISRGRLPQTRSGLVIIDESHRFRSPDTRRYRTIAPWLTGRRLLLLTATPMVNRLDDLAAQLNLGLRDDALRSGGLVSIRAGLAGGSGLHRLGEVVVMQMSDIVGAPARRDSTISLPQTIPAELIAGLDRLTNSQQRSIARLLQGVIWFAAASSPAALLAVLTRYRTLLHHAEDARSEGRPLSRVALREFTGGLTEQLMMWSLVDSNSALETGDLDLGDLVWLEGLIPQVRGWLGTADQKRQRLEELLADRRPTLVFTSARATVRYLRDSLSAPVAWCIGGRAGLGHTEVPREAVWRWFSPDHQWLGQGTPPATLICTDVAAEGLNLQRTERVIHYDLPWTPMRLAQRDGRAIRLGSPHAQVDVIRFLPPAALERRLGIARLLTTKLGLPARAGLGTEGRSLWRWRDEVAALAEGAPSRTGCAAIEGSGCPPGALIGVELVEEASGFTTPLLIWLSRGGEISEAIEEIEPRLVLALRHADPLSPTGLEIELALDRLWPVLRSRLAAHERNRWRNRRLSLEARILARRLHRLLGAAARRRDAVAMTAIDRGLRFVARGHTAGEALLVLEAASLGDRPLLERLNRMPDDQAVPTVPVPRVTGMLIFR